MADELQLAIAAIKAGENTTGKQLLIKLLKDDLNNENAWLWMTKVVNSPQEQARCLRNVLKINPDNEVAKRGLTHLQSISPTPQSAPPAAPPPSAKPPALPVEPKDLAPATPPAAELSLDPQQQDSSPVEPEPRPKPKALKRLSPSSAQLSTQPATKQCPYCAETIKAQAKVCRFCGRDLVTGQPPSPVPVTQQPQPQIIVQTPPQRQWSPGVAAVLSFFIPGLGQVYKGQIGRGLVIFFITAFAYTLLVIPGLIFHLIVVIDAAQGNPYDSSPLPGPAKTPQGSRSSNNTLFWIILLSAIGLVFFCMLIAFLTGGIS